MEDLEFFSKVDTMLGEALTIKSIEEMCEDFTDELKENNQQNTATEDKGERIVKKFLENLGYVFLSKSKDISCDYIFLKNGKQQMFEIKTEVNNTEDVNIEYQNKGEGSGIAATKADFFVTYYPHINEIWLIKTEKLKSLIRENKSTIKKTEHSSDEGINTKSFSLKKEDFKEHFRIANPYKKD